MPNNGSLKKTITKRLTVLLLFVFFALAVFGCDQPGAQHPREPLKSDVKVEEVRLETDDGLTLRGKVFGRGDKVGVVLAHMKPADQDSWKEFARELAADPGYTVLTFNFRGYGLSDGVKHVSLMHLDMLAATVFMEERVERVYLIGASMGGTAALNVASMHEVDGVATLSAPSSFEGLSVGDKLNEIKGPKLFIAAGEDGLAPDAARIFYDQVSEPRELEIVAGGAHGTDMLENPGDTVHDMLKTWLAKIE